MHIDNLVFGNDLSTTAAFHAVRATDPLEHDFGGNPVVQGVLGPTVGSLFGSARQAVASPPLFPHDYDHSASTGALGILDPLDTTQPDGSRRIPRPNPRPDPPRLDPPVSLDGNNMVQPTAIGGQTVPDWANLTGEVIASHTSTMSSGISFSPSNTYLSPSVIFPSTSQFSADPGGLPPALSGEATSIKLDQFASWEDIGFFLSLHIKRQHVLVPLIHKPSFASDVLHRRDQLDEAFRGLLLSIGEHRGEDVADAEVSYVICQTPIHLFGTRFSRPQLEVLLRRCQRGSRMIQIRHHMKPSTTILQSTILYAVQVRES